MDILTSMTRCLLFISGLDPTLYWEHALLHSATIQNRTALTGRTTPYEGQFGKRPNVTNFRIFGCEAMAYVEKNKRTKLDNKVERTIYLGASQDHSDDTAKLLSLKTMKIIYRRNVYYNERSFPARKLKFNPSLNLKDTGEDLLGLQFLDDDVWWTIKDFGTHDGHQVLFYTNNDNGQEEKSSVKEVREWYNRTQLTQVSTQLTQASNAILPTRKGYINSIAEASFKAIQQYDVKLPHKNVKKPTSFKKAGNSEQPQWFQAETKEKDGMLNFQTWQRLDQSTITPDIRSKALRCHHLYDIKRDLSAKNRVVVNGSKQHSDTYTDTTSPVAGQMMVRLFLGITAYR
jgi:hypothetical protein